MHPISTGDPPLLHRPHGEDPPPRIDHQIGNRPPPGWLVWTSNMVQPGYYPSWTQGSAYHRDYPPWTQGSAYHRGPPSPGIDRQWYGHRVRGLFFHLTHSMQHRKHFEVVHASAEKRRCPNGFLHNLQEGISRVRHQLCEET
jgi:hypothetical protein